MHGKLDRFANLVGCRIDSTQSFIAPMFPNKKTATFQKVPASREKIKLPKRKECLGHCILKVPEVNFTFKAESTTPIYTYLKRLLGMVLFSLSVRSMYIELIISLSFLPTEKSSRR